MKTPDSKVAPTHLFDGKEVLVFRGELYRKQLGRWVSVYGADFVGNTLFVVGQPVELVGIEQ